jgi:GGDEF domain-containing protein/DNA-binding response OmpR family regulator
LGAPLLGEGEEVTHEPSTRLTLLAMVDDGPSRSVLPKVLGSHRLLLARDATHALELAEVEQPEIALIDVSVGDGAGLAMVHHVKALAPASAVYALALPTALEAGAHALALGGAGLLLLPLDGDEVVSVVAAVAAQRAQQRRTAEVERAAHAHEQATTWIAEVAELAELDRATAAERLASVLMAATHTGDALIYLAMAGGATELGRVFATAGLGRAPAFGAELEILSFAAQAGLTVVPLTVRKLSIGHVLLKDPSATATDGLVAALAAQAATAFALLAEREHASGGGSMKDPTSSAYSFAYYADVAGREIDKARRHNRRFSIATVVLDDAESLPAGGAAEVADQLLKAARDIDVLARVDEREFHVLLPECDGMGAHASRRRMLGRLQSSSQVQLADKLLVGLATFPQDGRDLSQLLRAARRRAEQAKESVVHLVGAAKATLAELADARQGETSDPSQSIARARPFELSLAELAELAAAVVAESSRGGATFIAVAHHPGLCLGAAVRAAVGPGREGSVLHAMDTHAEAEVDNLEALAVFAEHGAYAIVGRSDGGVVRGIHAADPLLADLVGSLIGRAAGLRIFS